MCFVRLRFSCRCEWCRPCKGHESNTSNCRCDNISIWKLRFKCIECETPTGLAKIDGSRLEDLNEWVPSKTSGGNAAARTIDYEMLLTQLGSLRVDNALLVRFKRVTGHEPHHLFRRGIIFSHRDFEVILDRYERKEPFFIYAGRGPSSKAMHVGHVVAFQLAKWLAGIFEVPLLVMISDGKRPRTFSAPGIDWLITRRTTSS
jgi:hypothetical protein